MADFNMWVTVLGARGSVAVSGGSYAEFGGATSCYMVQAGGQTVFLDAGSGLLRAPTGFTEPPAVLLSHWHLDHVVGLGMYARLSQAKAITNLYGPASSDDDALQRLCGVYAPPYWPLELTQYPGSLRVHAVPESLRIGPLLVEAVEGNHPGGCLAYRLSCKEKSMVYATDYEHEPTSFARLVRLAKDADLLLYDAQYGEAEYAKHRGFGHSTASKGMELMEKSHAKRLLLIHHDPLGTDCVLRSREAGIQNDRVRYAREGEVIEL